MVLHRVKTYSSDPGGSILLFSRAQTIYNSHLCSKKILWNIAQFWNKRTVKVTVGFAHKSGDKLIWSELVENVLRVSLSAWVLSVGKEKKKWVIFPNSSIGNKRDHCSISEDESGINSISFICHIPYLKIIRGTKLFCSRESVINCRERWPRLGVAMWQLENRSSRLALANLSQHATRNFINCRAWLRKNLSHCPLLIIESQMFVCNTDNHKK